MAGESTSSEETSLTETPTWAIAVVFAALVIMSIFLEHALHLLTRFLGRKRRSLNQAVDKIKAEVMIFGFLSLLMTIMQQPISKICIPKSYGRQFLPCENQTLPDDTVEEPTCQEQDEISLLSGEAVNELHILMFVLAFFHVFSCVVTLGLGMAKMKRWQSWEEETTTVEYQFSNDPRRFRFTRQTSFGRRHLQCWSKHPLLVWPACFFRLFTGSVSKADYFTLRHGFITAHISEGSEFDFQKFVRRSLDSDFEVVVGISPWIWTFTVLFIFFNAHKFYTHLWLPFIPLVMILTVGTKLQVIITKMCLKSRDQSPVTRGTVLVRPNDNLFWFGRPYLLLHLVHFILFQNSFQLALFTWTWYKFGFWSCYHEETEDIIIQISVGISVQLLIGYVILPLYGLVIQMGSSMKKVVFRERVAKGLKHWHILAKRSLAANKSASTGPSPENSPRTTAPRSSVSSSTTLERSKTTQRPRPSSFDVESSAIEITEEPKPAKESAIEITEEPKPAKESAIEEITEEPKPAKESAIEITEEPKPAEESSTNTKGTYDGEISFGWC